MFLRRASAITSRSLVRAGGTRSTVWPCSAALLAATRSYATPGKIKVTITSKIDDKTKTIEAPTGITLMEAIVNVAKFDMEAACDGTCACSTCHVIFDAESFEKLPDGPSEDELDMLDLAPAVSRTSRLSCQVDLTPELNGIAVTIPDEMENQMS